jgi:hypothetical protein
VQRQSSWLLYSIIVVSALVIIGAIPLLLRARRAAVTVAGPDDSPADPAMRAPATDAAAGRMRVFGVDPYARRVPEARAVGVTQAVVERLWLRGTVSLLGAMGVALTGVAIGANFLAGRNDAGAWVAFGLAGAITVAMPAVMVFFQRQLREAVEGPAE